MSRLALQVIENTTDLLGQHIVLSMYSLIEQLARDYQLKFACTGFQRTAAY
jgi:hypothetical protein